MFGQKEDGTPIQDNSGTQDSGQPADDSVDQILKEQPQTVDPTPGEPLGEPAITPENAIDRPSGAPPADANRDVFSPAGGYPIAPSGRITTSGPVLSFGADETDSTDAAVAATPDDPVAATTPTDAANDADLIEIKQKVIVELAPLIDKLDLQPEEKFRTIMMMIQATDNEDLVELAYEAAHSIEDEKSRAQALLDIVNEINYFTQPNSSSQAS